MPTARRSRGACSPATGSCPPSGRINGVKLLIGEGVPANHLAATGFADFQPLDASDTSDSNAKNRRIELRLTDR